MIILQTKRNSNLQGYETITDPNTGEKRMFKRSTGEVVESVNVDIPVGSYVSTPEDIEERERIRAQQRDYFKQKEYDNQLGKFSFVAASQRFSDISPQTVARLVYLSTYIGYKSEELYITQRTPLKRCDIYKVLKLSERTSDRFWEEVHPKYLRINDNGVICINTDLFCYGRLFKNDYFYQKLRIEAVRKLYRSVPKSRHQELGYIFQMLPFINIEYNILCYNIFETDLQNIQCLTVKDFCKEIGFDYSTASRLIKRYSRICFDVNGEQEPFCAFVYAAGETKIFVNPHILYSGKDYHRVEVLGAFCKTA